MTPFARRVLALSAKDLALEIRSRDVVVGGVVFSLLVVLVMSFAVDPALAARSGAVGGLFWVTLLFVAGLTLGKGIAQERENGCLEMLLSTPGDRAAIFLGKASANALFILLVAALALPAFGVLFHVDLWGYAPRIAVLSVLGAIAIAAPGTLLGTMALETRAREMLLPILLLPMEVPVLIACVETMRAILAGNTLASAALWLRLLVAFDLVFVVVSAVLYDRLMDS